MASRQSGGSGGGMTDTTVGNYRIGSEIGRGSFAVVFKGHHMKNKSLAAIKVVQRSKLSRKLLENLESEIQILKKLNHPHIVALPDCKKTDKYIHLIMEYCSVSDLSVIIRKREKLASVHPCMEAVVRDYPSQPGGGLNEVLVRHFLKQLASALEFLRRDGLVHRDVKPQNLLLNPPPDYEAQFGADANMEGSRMLSGLRSLPVLKLADFGFARVLPAASMAETLCGSPLYMAPEILRYEKYDATADLWSVGTVLYEMITGKPPFRAPNHVDLLRKIETQNDQIRFPQSNASEEIKDLAKMLLKRNPVERMSFTEFFNHPVITGEIPGVKQSSIPEPPRSPLVESIRRESGEMRRTSSFRNRQTDQRALGVDREARSPVEPLSSSPRLRQAVENSALPFATHLESPHGTPHRLADVRRNTTQSPVPHSPIRERQMSRPQMPSHAATAPAREELGSHRRPTSAAMERVRSRDTDPSPSSSLLMQHEREYRQSDAAKERRTIHRRGQNSRELRNSGEDDYVFVDKQQVQVNAFADELATARRGRVTPPQSTALVRKSSSGGNHGSSPRPVGTTGRKAEYAASSKGSYERRFGSSPGSAKSTLAKALELANLRLFGVSLSPPNQSPPTMQSPFPPYVGPGSLVLIGNGGNMAEEDMLALQTIEESASRSDVVYNFAEVKFAQLMPAAPTSTSAPQGLGLVTANEGEASEGSLELTPDATILAAEECLVLFVKVLQLLSKATDIAHAWWAATNQRSEALNPARMAASTRMNNVVQWIRERFNEVLDKAEVVQQKIVDAQKDLPLSHPSHPNNQHRASDVSLGSAKSNFMLTTDVTAEKLMYDRALEMSRASAVNELVGEDLHGCEGAYVTAMRLLEAVLEKRDDDDPNLDEDDTKVIENMLVSIRSRLTSLRQKLAALSRTSKRSSIHSAHGSPHMYHPPSPVGISPSPSPMLK